MTEKKAYKIRDENDKFIISMMSKTLKSVIFQPQIKEIGSLAHCKQEAS